jgi:hypothetical protein
MYSSPFPTAKASAAVVDIDLCEQDVTVTVTFRWALNQATKELIKKQPGPWGAIDGFFACKYRVWLSG